MRRYAAFAPDPRGVANNRRDDQNDCDDVPWPSRNLCAKRRFPLDSTSHSLEPFGTTRVNYIRWNVLHSLGHVRRSYNKRLLAAAARRSPPARYRRDNIGPADKNVCETARYPSRWNLSYGNPITYGRGESRSREHTGADIASKKDRC